MLEAILSLRNGKAVRVQGYVGERICSFVWDCSLPLLLPIESVSATKIHDCSIYLLNSCSFQCLFHVEKVLDGLFGNTNRTAMPHHTTAHSHNSTRSTLHRHASIVGCQNGFLLALPLSLNPEPCLLHHVPCKDHGYIVLDCTLKGEKGGGLGRGGVFPWCTAILILSCGHR